MRILYIKWAPFYRMIFLAGRQSGPCYTGVSAAKPGRPAAAMLISDSCFRLNWWKSQRGRLSLGSDVCCCNSTQARISPSSLKVITSKWGRQAKIDTNISFVLLMNTWTVIVWSYLVLQIHTNKLVSRFSDVSIDGNFWHYWALSGIHINYLF